LAVAGEWPKITLREANVALIDCDHRTPPAANVGYPYVAIPQLRGGRIDLSDARRITREHFLEWTRKARPAASDVILSRRCNPGETAVAPPDLEFALGQNLVLLRADGTKVYPPFLRWLVRSPEWWDQVAKFINVGAVFDSLKCARPRHTSNLSSMRDTASAARGRGLAHAGVGQEPRAQPRTGGGRNSSQNDHM
jgi:type I restriction enzyme S subunit